jgi:hypothetical protein
LFFEINEFVNPVIASRSEVSRILLIIIPIGTPRTPVETLKPFENTRKGLRIEWSFGR